MRCIGDAARVQLVEQRRDEHVVGRRAREIGDRDDRGRVRARGDGFARELRERRGPTWLPERVERRGREVGDGCGRRGLDDVDVEPRLEHELQLLVAVGNAEDAIFFGCPLHRPTLTSGAAGHPDRSDECEAAAGSRG